MSPTTCSSISSERKRRRPLAAPSGNVIAAGAFALSSTYVFAFQHPTCAPRHPCYPTRFVPVPVSSSPTCSSRRCRSKVSAMPDWPKGFEEIGRLPKKKRGTGGRDAGTVNADTDVGEARHSNHEMAPRLNFTKTSSARLSIDEEALALPHFNTPPHTKSKKRPIDLTVQQNSGKPPSSRKSTNDVKKTNNDWIGAWGNWRDPLASDGNKPRKPSSVATRASDPKRKSSSSSPKPSDLKELDPSKPITVSDLQRILADGGYVRKSELLSDGSRSNASGSDRSRSNIAPSDTLSGSKTAFPQPSILSYKDVRIGTTIISAFCGLILAASVMRNLWLLGTVVGASYGSSIAQDTNDPEGPVGQLLVNLGRNCAKKWLQVYDFASAMWFMYRTGQLSYDYWKRYEDLDRRLGITDKVDAWNARFVQGKRSFDQWEKDNEVGRKILATLRTAWMVEEQSYKRQLKRRADSVSKYATIKYIQNFGAWVRRIFFASWNIVAGERQGELRELFAGIKIQLKELMDTRVVIQRAGSAISLLVLVNAIGALFASSPGVLSLLACVSGIIWPDWAGLTVERMLRITDETRALGRGESTGSVSSGLLGTSLSSASSSSQASEPVRFSFFERKDGSKRYYRTGRPLVAWTKLRGEGQGQEKNFLAAVNPFKVRGKKDTKTSTSNKSRTEENGPFAFFRK